MATKVKPIRLNITWTPQVWNVPTYVDADTFAWWAGWGWGASFGRFLSLWDSTTGQPISFPEATPYSYLTWDYYIVETISSATPPVNYRPTWSSYTGTASSVTESDEVEVWDTYVYDGTTWLLQSNHGKTVTFANIAGDPYDNANLDSALDAKQDVLVSWTNIKTVNNNSLLWSGNVSVWDVKYTDYNWTTLTGNSVTLALNSQITPAANFTINAPWTIKDWQEYILRVTSGWTVYAITLGTNMSNPNNVDTTLTANSVDQFVFLAVWWQLELQPRDKDTTYTAWTWININWSNQISNTWVTSVNGSTWAVTVETPNTKTFYLSSTSDLTNAQAAYDWYAAGKNAIIVLDGQEFLLAGSPDAQGYRLIPWINSYGTVTTYPSGDTTRYHRTWLQLIISSSTVTSVSLNSSYAGSDIVVLDTNTNYTTPYQPQYDGSPATKKYVDDHAVPAVWTNWQVLTVVSWAAAWANAPVWIQNDTTWTTTTVTKIWAGTEAEYNTLGTYDTSTIYHIY